MASTAELEREVVRSEERIRAVRQILMKPVDASSRANLVRMYTDELARRQQLLDQLEAAPQPQPTSPSLNPRAAVFVPRPQQQVSPDSAVGASLGHSPPAAADDDEFDFDALEAELVDLDDAQTLARASASIEAVFHDRQYERDTMVWIGRYLPACRQAPAFMMRPDAKQFIDWTQQRWLVDKWASSDNEWGAGKRRPYVWRDKSPTVAVESAAATATAPVWPAAAAVEAAASVAQTAPTWPAAATVEAEESEETYAAELPPWPEPVPARSMGRGMRRVAISKPPPRPGICG